MQNKGINFEQMHQAVCDGIYATQPSFNHKQQNLLDLISYLEVLEPTLENLQRAFKLIKFYRFPLVIAFRSLYQRINEMSSQEQTKLEDTLKEIASYVALNIELAQIKIFEEIKFVFQWGKGKKKYKLTISPQEVQFSKFIYGLSQEKKHILTTLSINKEEDVRESLAKFEDSTLQRALTPFEKLFTDHIKESAIKNVEEIQLQNPQKQSKQKNQQKSSSQIKKPSKHQQTTTVINPDHKIKAEQKYQKMQQLRQDHQNIQKIQNQKQGQITYEKERQLHICCRRYFLKDQVVQQPQSLRIQYKFYKFPFKDRLDQKPGKGQKIKRTLCGFLNSQGGIIYFGIKENDDTKKREIGGYIMSQKTKLLFRSTIFNLLKDVRPEAQSKCIIKWVPIKSKATNQFIPGMYIPKVIIERGAKDNLYSYMQGDDQKFVFKTENEFLAINEPQKILKMFHDKIKYPQRQIYKLHEHPCFQPLIGHPVYTEPQNQYIIEDQFPRMRGNQSYRQNQKYISYDNKPKRFKQVGTKEHLLFDVSKEQIKSLFAETPERLGSITVLTPKCLLVVLHDPKSLKLCEQNSIKVIPAYQRVKCSMQSQDLKEDIIAAISKVDSTQIKSRDNNILSFHSTEQAAKFWLKVIEIDPNCVFTPQT